ncbi:MAG: hypothetical protein KGH55_01180 [Nanoarchaeota archaeon]|nr:hypothetical protein [Nanoarchaeota archaeon]
MTTKFLRRGWSRYSKLGLRRKKKQIWRRPHGRDNKMREKRKGYPSVVSIGHRKEKNSRGKINEQKTIVVRNINELKKTGKGEMAVFGKIGKKKKIEMAKFALENKIQVHNLNINKFLKEQKKK